MALLGSLRSYSPRLPGFWDYPSGTIGDALLVPTLVAGLLIQARALRGVRVKGEVGIGIGAAIVGFVGGAVVPLSWYLGSNTKPIWMLPRPHHYLLAGWVHTVYLSAATATIVLLSVTAFRRLRATRDMTGVTGEGLSITAMTMAIGAGLGMLAFVGRDSALGGFTAATATTVIALIVVAVLFLGGLAWACGVGVYRQHWRGAIIVVAFVSGLVALMVQWKPPEPAIIGIAAVIAALGTYAATSPLRSDPVTRPYRYPAAFAMTALLVGGLARSVEALARAEPSPLLWLLGGAALAVIVLWVVAPGSMPGKRIVGFGLFLGYCMFTCYLAERTLLPHAAPGPAGAALGIADMAFDVLVISVVQTRFSDLGAADVAAVESEYITQREHEQDPGAYLGPPREVADPSSSPDQVIGDVFPMGFAVGIGLLTLLAISAKTLGLDRHAAEPSAIRLLALAGPILALILLGVTKRVMGTWRARVGEPPLRPQLTHLHLPSWYWVMPTIGAACWTALFLTLSGGTPHVPLLAAAAAVLMFFLSTKSLIWTTSVVQTLTPTRGNQALGVIVGLATAVATFWLISFGMWQGGRPIAGGWLSATVVVIFLGNASLFVLGGYTMAWGLPAGRRTQQVLCRGNVDGYLLMDTSIFNVVLAIGLVIPVYAALRDSVLHVSPLYIVASMAFIPGFAGAVLWGLRNWTIYDDLIQRSRAEHGLPRVLLARAEGEWDEADTVDTAWRRRLHFHLQTQWTGVAALGALGLVELARVLLE
jgi:hypothetical protein